MPNDVEPWEEHCISTWDEYDSLVGTLPQNQWLYRGHHDASWWPKTSLYRAFEDALPIIEHKTGSIRMFARNEHERLLIDRFKRSAHLYRSTLPKPDELLEWLAIMQHYGAPTRLLDVTISPYIAVYFALEQGNGDCVVFAFDHVLLRPKGGDPTTLQQRVFKNLRGPESFVVAFRPRMTTERLLAQQGAFLVPSNNYESIAEIVHSLGVGESACKKIILKANLRLDGIERLRRMNLTSTALFPGIEGFCRSLRFQIFEKTKTQKLLQ